MTIEQAKNSSLLNRAKGKLIHWAKEGQEITSNLIAVAMLESAEEEAALAKEMIAGKTPRANTWLNETIKEAFDAANK